MNELDIKKILSLNIKKYRKLQSLSQFELSEKADLSDQTINSIEGCRLWPSDKTLAKIAEALGVEIFKLFIPQEIGIAKELEKELKLAVAKSVEKTVLGLLKEV